jgi:thiamine-monophosphate kinase
MSERSRIARLLEILSKETSGVTLGIGDDAAVLSPPPGMLVWTVDEQVEGTHFTLDLVSPEDLGWRSVMAAASDLAAMGASPWCALASVVLPEGFSEESFDALATGQRRACDALGGAMVGGNLARGTSIAVSTTWLGTAARPVLRSGARPGDGVYVHGALGLAAAGLDALRRGIAVPEEAILAFRRPTALIEAGLRMAKVATSAIDVSDGLAGDCGHVAEASGVKIVLDASLPVAPALIVAARALDREPLDLVLDGGEDYAIVCTSSGDIEGFARIGVVAEGRGVWLRDGSVERPLHGGFDHFG